MTRLTMHPNTNATVKVTVTSKDPQTQEILPVTDATVVGTLRDYDFKAKSDVNVPFAHTGSGVYALVLQAAWTLKAANVPDQGLYTLDVKITRDQNTLSERIEILVQF